MRRAADGRGAEQAHHPALDRLAARPAKLVPCGTLRHQDRGPLMSQAPQERCQRGRLRPPGDRDRVRLEAAQRVMDASNETRPGNVEGILEQHGPPERCASSIFAQA